MADFSNKNAATSYAQQGNRTAAWVSINSTLIAPQVRAKLNEKYGHLIGISDFVDMPQNRIYIKNADYTVWSKWAPERAITTAAAISTGSAGANIQIVMASSMMDANGNFPVRVNHDVIIPGKYQTGGYARAYSVQSVTTTTETNDTLVCVPWTKAGTYNTAAQIGTEVPTGTTLMVGASAYGPGTGQGTAMTDTYTSEFFRARILKEKWAVEGGQGALSLYEPIEFNLYGGGKGITRAEIVRAEMRLKRQKDKYFRTGEINDNTTLTATSNFGGTNVIKSGNGFDVMVDTYGQLLPYVDNPSFDDFSDASKLAETQGVAAKAFDVFQGVEIARGIGDLTKDIIKEYSGGSDLLDARKQALGCNINCITWGNNTFYLHTLASTGDPSSYGVMTSGVYSYDYPDKAFVIPQGMNEVEIKSGDYLLGNKDGSMSKKSMGMALMPNLMTAYVNYGGENRETFGGTLVGPNGFGLGDGKVASQYDGVEGYVNTECALIVINANQIIKWYKSN